MDKKALQREFLLIGLSLIIYEAVFFIGGVLILYAADYIAFSIYPETVAEEIIDNLYNSSITEIVTASLGTLAMCLFYREKPGMQKQKKISVKTVIFMGLLIYGIQLLGSYLIMTIEELLYFKGYDMSEAIEIASAPSICLSGIIYSIIVAPISEEIIMRGFIMRKLEPHGKAFALIISAVLFGLSHGNLAQLSTTTALGIIFGLAAQQYSLGAAIILHMLNNLSLQVSLLGEIAEWIDMMVLIVGGIVLVVTVIRKRREIKEYLIEGKAKENVPGCFFTSPFILIYMALTILLTISSATAI